MTLGKTEMTENGCEIKTEFLFLEFKGSFQQIYFKVVQRKNQAFCLCITAKFEADFCLCKGGFDIPCGITNSKDGSMCI